MRLAKQASNLFLSPFFPTCEKVEPRLALVLSRTMKKGGLSTSIQSFYNSRYIKYSDVNNATKVEGRKRDFERSDV